MDTADNSSSQPNMAGVDVVTTSRVVGWLRSGRPDRRSAQIVVDGEVVATVPCNRERPDLSFADPPAFGFVHRFPAPVREDQLVGVRTLEGDLFEGMPVRPVAQEGNLEQFEDGILSGWAEHNAKPAILEIYADDVPVRTIVCNWHRADCAEQGLHHNVGFRFKLPRTVLPARSIAVRFDGGRELPNSPKANIPWVSPPRDPARPKHHAGRRLIVVLGMRLSGSSLCANLLSLLGVDIVEGIGRSARDARAHHWERPELAAFHDLILNHFDRGWDGARQALSLPNDWLSDPFVEDIRQDIMDWLDSQLDNPRQLGFKDRRTCRLMPLWDTILAEFGLESGFVVCLRHPSQVARSLSEREGLGVAGALYRWMAHNYSVIEAVGDRPYTVIPYEKWFSEPGRNMATLAKVANAPWPPKFGGAGTHLLSAVDPDFRHDELQPGVHVPPIAIDLYNSIMSGERIAALQVEVSAFLASPHAFDPLLSDQFADAVAPVKRTTT